MDSDILLFISSTSDLKAERQALEQELHSLYKLFLYEDFGAGGDSAGHTSPEDILREQLKKTDVFICLLGSRYGSIYKDKSIVEWEFATARSFQGVQIMPFIKVVPPEQIEARQNSFIQSLTGFGPGGMWCERFDSAPNLVKLVREALEKWLIRQFKQTEAKVSPWLNRILTPVAIGLVVLCVVVSLLFVMQVITLSKTSVLGFCVIIFFTLLFCFLMLWSQIGGRNVSSG